MNGPIFANSGIVRAPERLVIRDGAWRMLDIKVRYGVWLHQRLGPVLIDTGYGKRVTEGRQRSLALKIYSALLRPRLVAPGLLPAQLSARGLSLDNVGVVVVTHFHADHVAALSDFPAARFVASGAAWDALMRMSRFRRVERGVFMELLPDDFASRLTRIEEQPEVALPHGLGTGHDLFGDGSCLSVPLPGHAPGHFGLLWPGLSPPLLYAVDTQWLWRAIADDRPPSGPARLIFDDWQAALASAEKIRRFAASGGEVVLCHEPGDNRHDR